MSDLDEQLILADLSPHLRAAFQRCVDAKVRAAREEERRRMVESHEPILCPQHPGDLFSQVHVDSTLSALHSSAEIAAVKFIYLVLAYGSKLPYFEGSPKFALRGLNFLEPGIENIIVGECQSGKSAEAAWIAWCSFFILGSLPIIFVRNTGGKIQGRQDMRNAVEKLNQRIQDILEEKKSQTVLGEMGVKKDQLKDWINLKRFNINVEFEEAAIDGSFEGKGKALVVLQNPTHLKKVMNGFSRKAQFISATISKQIGNKWEVTFKMNGQKALLPVTDLRDCNDHKLRKNECVPGCRVKARIPEERRWHSGVIATMNELYGKKRVSKIQKSRIVFVMDEADLFVGNAKRRGNKSSTMMFHEKIRGDVASGNRGAREYVLGSVYITATPQALYICDWKASQKAPQENDEDSDTQSDCEVEDDSEDGDSDASNDSFSRTAAARARQSNWSQWNRTNRKTVEVLNGSGSETDKSSSDDGTRFLKPHVVFADRPDNYAFYEAGGWPTNGNRIERMKLDERDLKIKSKFEIYEMYFKDHFDPASWDKLKKAVGQSGKAQDIPEWPGFMMVRNPLSKTLSIRAPSKKQRNNQPRCGKIFDEVDAFYQDVRDRQRSMTTWEQDGTPIRKMVEHMICDTAAEYRHALVISVNTKRLDKQGELQRDILRHFAGSQDLAVAIFNTKGILVRFSDAMHAARPGLIKDAYTALQSVIESQCRLRCERVPVQPAAAAAGSPSGNDGDEEAEWEKTLLIRNQPIEVMYETLKGLASRVVVIAGEIGGRGVAYHDIRHERILTDMYTAIEVFNDRIITQHGELVVQFLGRLNTIHTFGHRCPTIRLWASKSVHALHQHYLEEIHALCVAVQKYKDYQAAFESRPQWHTGMKPSGEGVPATYTRSPFRKDEAKMWGPKKRNVSLPKRRNREQSPPQSWSLTPTQSEEALTYKPEGSKCDITLRMPHSFQDDEDEAERTGEKYSEVLEKYLWHYDEQGENWSAEEHIAFEVRVPSNLFSKAAAEKYLARARRGLPFKDCEISFILKEESLTGRRKNLLFQFKTLWAAQGFILAGAAGQDEAALFEKEYGGTSKKRRIGTDRIGNDNSVWTFVRGVQDSQSESDMAEDEDEN